MASDVLVELIGAHSQKVGRQLLAPTTSVANNDHRELWGQVLNLKVLRVKT